MGFIKKTFKRKFEFKHFGVSHTIDHDMPGYEPTPVFNPSTQQTITKHVQRFDGVEGLVIDAEWYDRTDNGGTRYVGYVLTVDIGEEVILLDFPYPKSSFRTLVRHGANINWSKPVEFSAWKSKTPNGKDACAVCFWQVGPDGKRATIKAAHTKENPNGCPEPKRTLGKWDFRDQDVWLKTQFDKICLPRIKAAGEARQTEAPKVATATVDGSATTVINDPYGEIGPGDYPPEGYDDEVPF